MDQLERREWMKRAERVRRRDRNPETLLLCDFVERAIVALNAAAKAGADDVGPTVSIVGPTTERDVETTLAATAGGAECPKCIARRRSKTKAMGRYRARKTGKAKPGKAKVLPWPVKLDSPAKG